MIVIAGANRHAKEVCQILNQQNRKFKIFDDYSLRLSEYFSEYEWIRSIDQLKLSECEEFILALGGTKTRQFLAKKLRDAGLRLKNVIASTAVIGTKSVLIEDGINAMHFSFISDCTTIGEGTLINSYAAIHHDVSVGKYCELSPKATLLGGSKIGDFTSVGSAAVILPNIEIGKNCIIGAGAIVTKNVGDNAVMVGVPARKIKEIDEY
jgi:sugar O-acyltransferase (sialic acid O-acetyltransferase NeuD family)